MLQIINLSEPPGSAYNRLTFQYYPEKVAMKDTINLSENSVIGRNEPLIQMSGGKTTCSFSLEFYSKDERLQDAIYAYNWLHSLRYIDETKPFPLLKIVWGNLFQSNQSWVLTEVNGDLSQFIKSKNNLPKIVTIGLSFTEVVKENTTTREQVLNRFKQSNQSYNTNEVLSPEQRKELSSKYVFKQAEVEYKEEEERTTLQKIGDFLTSNEATQIDRAFAILNARGNPSSMIALLPLSNTAYKRFMCLKYNIVSPLKNLSTIDLANLNLTTLPNTLNKLRVNTTTLVLTGNSFSEAKKNKIRQDFPHPIEIIF